MSLEIRTTPSLIGIDRTPSKLNIETRNARLELHQKHAKINIRTELPRILIDQYECFAEAGLKNLRDLTREFSQRGYQQVMEFIGKTAEDGGRLAAIEKGGNPIAEIAKRDAFPVHEFGLDTIPKSRPKFDVTGSVQFDPERNSEGVNNGVEGEFIPNSINIDYSPAQIKVYMRQYGSIDIHYKGGTVDTYL